MKKVLVSLPEGVYEIIRDLKGKLGESDSAIIRNIVIAYLSEQGYFSRFGVITGIPSSNKEVRVEQKIEGLEKELT